MGNTEDITPMWLYNGTAIKQIEQKYFKTLIILIRISDYSQEKSKLFLSLYRFAILNSLFEIGYLGSI